MDVMGRIPPHSIEAEKSVLGSMLLDKDVILDILESLHEDDFYNDSHKEIFNAIQVLNQRSEPVDIVTLSQELMQMKTLELIGGRVYLGHLSNSVPTTANVEYYVKIIEEKSVLRKLIQTSSELMNKGYNEEDEIAEILDFAEKSVFDISQKRDQKGFTPIKDALIQSIDLIDQMSKLDGSMIGLTTGFVDIDRETSGLQKSDLILIAARPSMGKTAFALNLAQNAAIRGKASVAIFSLEMSKEQLVQRMLSSEAMLDIQKIRTGKLDENEWLQLAKAIDPLSQANIFIDDTAGATVMDMKTKCRKLKMSKGLDLIVIDYLQLMSGNGKIENRQQEISTISRNLKMLAKEMECPVIALSQLSRAPEMRSDHRPMLSDLRESGAIEQDADIVMFLYRDEYYNKEESEKPNIGELIIAKQRNGPTGTVELAWLGQYAKFADSYKG